MTDKILLVYVNGQPPYKGVSAKGNDYTIHTVFVRAGAPFPEKVQTFDDPKLGEGYYNVPYSIAVDRDALAVKLDFSKAVKVEAK